ncbi:PfkB family carbohydrate kinase [Pedococcus soli]
MRPHPEADTAYSVGMATHDAEAARRPRSVRPRVIHSAQALVDEVVEVASLPERGGNAVATSYSRYAGGAVNILVAAARSGAVAVHAGSVGTGANGDLVRAALAADGVSLSSPVVPDSDTGICVVMVEPSAERTFVTTQGAERDISVASLDTSAPVAGDLVCVSGFSLVGRTRDPLRQWLSGLADDVVVVLDPGDAFGSLDDSLREEVLARTNVWTSNADEALTLTGVQVEDDSAAAVALRLPDGAIAIVRDGSKGCHVHEAGHTAYLAGHPQEAVDTNGAGDTHTGVLLAERARGADWLTAARRANAAGAIKVTRRGPATAPTAAEIDAFLATAGVAPVRVDRG